MQMTDNTEFRTLLDLLDKKEQDFNRLSSVKQWKEVQLCIKNRDFHSYSLKSLSEAIIQYHQNPQKNPRLMVALLEEFSKNDDKEVGKTKAHWKMMKKELYTHFKKEFRPPFQISNISAEIFLSAYLCHPSFIPSKANPLYSENLINIFKENLSNAVFKKDLTFFLKNHAKPESTSAWINECLQELDHENLELLFECIPKSFDKKLANNADLFVQIGVLSEYGAHKVIHSLAKFFPKLISQRIDSTLGAFERDGCMKDKTISELTKKESIAVPGLSFNMEAFLEKSFKSLIGVQSKTAITLSPYMNLEQTRLFLKLCEKEDIQIDPKVNAPLERKLLNTIEESVTTKRLSKKL